MSINRENTSSQTSKLLAYLGITFTFQFIGFITTFAYSSYFNRTETFAQSFLFRSSDSPAAIGLPRPSPFGNHLFGDYLDVYSQIRTTGMGGYFGASQLFLIIASRVPYYYSLIGMLVTCVVLFFVAARSLLNSSGVPEQLALLFGGFLFTQPLLLAIDRGQMHLLMFALLLLGFTLSIKDDCNSTSGAILMAAAISMKLTPVFFLLLFVRKKLWRELKVGLVAIIGFMLLPLAYLDSGIGAWKSAFGFIESSKENGHFYNSTEYFSWTLAYNNSFKLLSYEFSRMDSSLGKVGSFAYEHYLWFAGFLCLFLGWLIIQKSVTQFESVLLMAIASSLLIPIAGGYTLLVFILPIVVVLGDSDFRFGRINIIYCCFIGIILMPKQIAIGFATFQDTSVTLGGILNPSLSLIMVLFITCKCLYLRRKQFVESNHQLI